ncbi:low-density lipoprotein receptor-related protein 4-like [Porites lutea]|uniref:low-density lipoprotein receptor-related protein 4-like n=1 Tax=Porites lutea TaxID=51062 RepID=UPI003CC5C93D
MASIVTLMPANLDKHARALFVQLTDQCKNNNGGCSQLCLLTQSGRVCACSGGLILDHDGRNCRAPPEHEFLLFADASYGKIMKVSPHAPGSLISLPLSSIISRPVAIGYDVLEDRVYWTDVTRNTISRSFLNGSMFEVLFYQNVQSPDGLAVDIVGRNLYWTDTGTDKLEVSKLDGSYRKALITSGLDEPRDIILDISKGIMYWTDWGYHAKIERADMSGQQRVVLVNASLSWPNGLTLDQERNRLYWVDARYDKLEYLHLSTNTRVTLIDSSATLPHPFGLTLLGEYLYWTDWSDYTVKRANKESAADVMVFVTGIGQPMDIHGYNLSENIIPVTDQCNNNNGGCSQLCLLTQSGRVCACSGGLILDNDGRNCKAPPEHEFLLFADSSYGKIMKVSPHAPGSLRSLPLSSIISRPVAIGYDVLEDRVYWTDVTRNTISRSFLNGTMFEVLFYQNVQSPDGLAVDIVGRNLYWTDTGTNKLEVSKLDGSYRKALITSGLDEPRDIILDVSKGIMYWTDWGYQAKIERAEMSGQERVVLVNSSLSWPNGLTLDQERNRLYWVDARYDKLEYLHLSTNTRVTLIDSSATLPHPFGLTLLGDYLYWTDWNDYTVKRANKESAADVTVFVTGIGQPMDIHGYNLSEKTIPENPCSSSFGGCSHLCLLRPNGYLCSCPDQLAPGDVCINGSIPLPFKSTHMGTATYSQYQKSSVKVRSTVISFSSVKPSSSSVSSQWPTTSVTSTSRITSSSTIMSQSRLRTSSLTASSTSLLPMISSHGLTSAFPSQRQTTVESTSQPPPTLAPSECRPGDCENNGTCIVPGYYCRCLKYYVWHRCSVYVGAKAVEIELSFQIESGPIDSLLKIALAEACTKYFCENGQCKRRVKRSESPKYFTPNDIHILGFSPGAQNSWKIEFAVLFPSVDGQTPEIAEPGKLVEMVSESKESIGKALGATIQRVTVVPEAQLATEKPTDEPIIPKKQKSVGESSSIVPIGAGVGVAVVVVVILLAFVIYRMKRNGRADNRVAASDNIPLENDWTYNAAIYSEVSFDNPGFNENPVNDSLSLSEGSANDGAMRELGFTDLPNEMKLGEGRHASYRPLEVNARSNPMFGIPDSGDSRTDESGERYCVLTGSEEKEACASLRNQGTNHLQDKDEYLKLAEPQFKDSRNSPIYVDRESHA